MEENSSINNNLHGQWVILLDEHIVASGNNIQKLIEGAKEKHPHGKLVLAQVPEKGTLIY